MSAVPSKRRSRPVAAYLSLLLCLVYVDAVTSMVSCTSSEDGASTYVDAGAFPPPDARTNDASGSGEQDAQQPNMGLDASPPEMGLDAEVPDDAEPPNTDPDDADTDEPDGDVPDAAVDEPDADADTDPLIDAALPLIDAADPLVDAADPLIDAALVDAADLVDALPDAP